MIYTVGKKENYDLWLEKLPLLEKQVGGSVWETFIEAHYYLECTGQIREFDVYGVEADWDKDANKSSFAAPWKILNKKAKIVKLL